MYQQEQALQRLRRSFDLWLPWLRTATYAAVKISPTGQGNAFAVTATWKEGEYRKVYDASALKQWRVTCTKDYARAFVREVLEKRGAIT